MNMACVLKKQSFTKAGCGQQVGFGPRFPMEARTERWSLPVQFILLPDTVLFISNCQHSVSAKEAQEHVGATGRPAHSWHLLMAVIYCWRAEHAELRTHRNHTRFHPSNKPTLMTWGPGKHGNTWIGRDNGCKTVLTASRRQSKSGTWKSTQRNGVCVCACAYL